MSDTSAIPRVGQIGTAFTATIDEPDPNNPGSFLVVDLTNAETVWIEFQKPDKTKFRKEGIVYGDPLNGQVRYVDGTGLFDTVGDWQFRGVVLFDDSSEYPGSWYLQNVGS